MLRGSRRSQIAELSHSLPRLSHRVMPCPRSVSSLKAPVSDDWSRRESQCPAPLLQAGQLRKSISTPELPMVLSEALGQLRRCSASRSAGFCFPHSLTGTVPESIPPPQKRLPYTFQTQHLLHREPSLYQLLQKVVLGSELKWDFRAGSRAGCLPMKTLSLVACGVPAAS